MRIKNVLLTIQVLVLLSLTLFADPMMSATKQVMARVKGTLVGYSDTSDYLIVSTKHGFLSVGVNAITVIKRDGSRVAMDDLMIGERITLRYNRTNMMTALAKVKLPCEDGFITNIKANGPRMNASKTAKADYEVTVTPAGGNPRILKIDADAIIVMRDGTQATPDQLQIGDNASAAYHQENGMITVINATSVAVAPTVETGVISLLNLGDPTVLELTTDIHTVPMTATDATTKVSLDGSPATLNDLREGFTATISYDQVNLIAFQINAISN